MTLSWSTAIGLVLMNVVLGAVAVSWWRRAGRTRGGDAPRWHQLEALSMTAVAATFVGALNLFMLAGLGGPAWLFPAGQVVVVAGVVIAAVLSLAQRLLRAIEDRQDRRFRVAAGLPVRRRLWHPGLIAALWAAALLPGLWVLGKLGEWGLTWYYGDRPVTAAENARVVHVLTRGLTGLFVLYLVAATTHVLVQVLRRRRDDRRVREQDQALLTDRTGLAPLPSVWLPSALAGSGRRWRWALQDPLDPGVEPAALRAAPPALRWGYLAALAAAGVAGLTLWSLTTVGVLTATDQPPVGRMILALVWLGVTAAMTNALGPDLARALRGIVRAVRHPGPAGPARP